MADRLQLKANVGCSDVDKLQSWFFQGPYLVLNHAADLR